MDNKQPALLQWLLPSRLELVFYLFIGLLTVALSNLAPIKRFFLIPADFGFHLAILDSLDSLLHRILGYQTPAVIAISLLWGAVGCLIYSLVWLARNFSAELSNDLAVKKYVNPQGSDPYSPAKVLVERTLFRLVNTALLVVAISLLIKVLLPIWAASFQSAVQLWPATAYILSAVWALAAEIICLHVITILIRLALLRKRVFG